jgi:vesicle-fusing ATPase
MSGYLPSRNNLFGGRDNSPQPPRDQYGQPPRDQYSQRGGSSYGYDQPMNGYDPRGHSQTPPYNQGLPPRNQGPRGPSHQSTGSRGGGRGQRWQLSPTKSPDNTYTFRNLVAVSSAEFAPSRDGSDLMLIVNGKFVVSARVADNFSPGQIGMSEPQRTWMGVALTDMLDVEMFDIFSQGSQAYLGSMDIEVGFASKNKTPQAPYDQDELAKEVAKVCHSSSNFMSSANTFPRYFRTKFLPPVRDSSWT